MSVGAPTHMQWRVSEVADPEPWRQSLGSAVEMVTIEPLDLQAAQEQDGQ
jgi:hypothetical protein